MQAARRIDSARNPLVKSVAALRTRRERDRTGTTLVEGLRETERASAAGLRVVRLLLAEELWPAGTETAAEALCRTPALETAEVVMLSADAFDRISLRQHPDGVAAVVVSPARDLEHLVLPNDPLVLVLDGIEKPGNVGALLRTADAAGVDGVVVTGDGTDLGNPNVVRASMGSVFALPVAAASTDEARTWLQTTGLRLVATTPHARSAHWEADYRGSVAVALGSEHAGLDASWLAAADERVRIPMRARAADSLNVSVAGAVVLFEAMRQRQA
ncbi:MAG: RNA methyltransferase [Deinococcales bacterium]|jgi:TrmH family RNA methyltransferase